MSAAPESSLLTPPPDTALFRNPHGKTMNFESENSLASQRRPSRPLDDSSEEEELNEDITTTTTTTTTATTVLGAKPVKGFPSGLNESASKCKGFSPPSDGNGSDVDHSSVNHSTLHNGTFSAVASNGPRQGSTLFASVDSPVSLSSNSSGTSRSSTSPGTPYSSEAPFHSTLLSTSTSTSSVSTRKRKVRRPTFEARGSRLDPETMNKNKDPFRGFHTLFWIVMGAYGLITFDEEWTRAGKAFGGTLFSSFSQDAIILAISDFGLVLSTGVAFVLIKAVAKGWIRYKSTGMIVQHCVQLLFLLVAMAWTIWRDWPWVQSGFFTLHALTMLMKIHSYIAYNGELSEKLILLRKSEADYARIKKNDTLTADDDERDTNASTDSSANGTHNDNDNHDSTTTASGNSTQDASHHHRLASEAAAALLKNPAPDAVTFNAAMLVSEIEELKGDLTTENGELWPANVTIANFVDYLIVPSLIYELQYPRTSSIRPIYVLEKSVATLGTFTLLYLTTEHYIYPVVFDPSISPMRALVLLLIPFMMNYLMIFYIIFECICNAFAELSRFADRNFYEDWWNCVSFDEWARKWNKPVHHFLLRHVYDSSIESFHLSKSNAAFITFFLSSCVHELVMMMVTRKFRLYLFALQMFQLPLIWMGNNRAIRDRPRLANAVFWLGMFCGPPLLGVAYCYA